jgi:LmbE family N-acetylglucosaminyl deacetylase
MSRILYVFPHPDDESFGPAPVLAKQRREGHEVFLLTLTKGEATRQRHALGYSLEEMGEVRYREMQCVSRVLDLSGLTVLDFPDGGLSGLDPIEIEKAIEEEIVRIEPDVLVTYPLHGISGHLDHVTTHAVVQRVFCDLRRRRKNHPRRLAFFTLPEKAEPGRPSHLKSSPDEAIDCVVRFEEEDMRRAEKALDCYETYKAVIEAQNPLAQVRHGVSFELFQESYDPPLDDLFDGMS